MTGMDLGSLLSDLVAAKKKMREKKGAYINLYTLTPFLSLSLSFCISVFVCFHSNEVASNIN